MAEGTDREQKLSEHSIWPGILALGLLIAGMGILTQVTIAALGAVVILVALVGWLWQPWTS